MPKRNEFPATFIVHLAKRAVAVNTHTKIIFDSIIICKIYECFDFGVRHNDRQRGT